MSGFLCSSIRFYRKQQAEIKALGESVIHWTNEATNLDDECRHLKSTVDTLRSENHPGKQAIDLIATINKSCEDFHNSQMPF